MADLAYAIDSDDDIFEEEPRRAFVRAPPTRQGPPRNRRRISGPLPTEKTPYVPPTGTLRRAREVTDQEINLTQEPTSQRNSLVRCQKIEKLLDSVNVYRKKMQECKELFGQIEADARALGIAPPVAPPDLSASNLLAYIEDTCPVCRDAKPLMDSVWNSSCTHRFCVECADLNSSILQQCPACRCAEPTVFYSFVPAPGEHKIDVHSVRSPCE